jgi:hypothetical protein
MKHKFEKLNEFISALNSIPTTDTNGKEIKDKLTYACTKLGVKLSAVQKQLNEKINDINIELCSTDKDGIILVDDKGQYKFSKEGLKNKNKKVKQLFETEEFELEPYICTDNTRVEELSYWVKQTLNGVLFKVELDE